MKTSQKYIFSLLAATAMLGAGTTQANALLIDDFSVRQDTGLQPLPSIPSSSQVGPDISIIGGFRDIEVMGDADDTIETRIRATGTALSFSNDDGTTGFGTIVWDGDDDPTVLDPMGLGGIDLTDHDGVAVDRLLVEIISADLAGLELHFNIYDLVGGVSTLLRDFGPIGDSVTEAFLFDNFMGDADFTNVGAIELKISGPAEIDARLAMIETGKRRVPEPLTSLWTLAGVSALGGLCAKKKVASRN
ncbi:MAG: PEP-CTERM sorting domain-containing protein [Cyanobacteriota bacterium]|nr:PEP-CTERM sorting domain-containing protein [Cyanobacteriota bacterium]